MITTIVSFIVVIGILILIHEFGHFFVARWTGVGVERFSIGFGPVLLRWRGKETEYCLSAIPMGGYVKMMGEESPLEGGGTPDYDPKKSFALKPLWARFLIVFAGPGMNLVLAIAIAAAVLMTVGRPVWPPVVGRVSDGQPAAAAGLKSGDVVTAVNGKPVKHWEDLERAVAASDGTPLELQVTSAGAPRTLKLTPQKRTIEDPLMKESRTVWDIGAGPRSIPHITSVGPGSPAAVAGLKPDDVVIAVGGQRVYTAEELVQAIRSRPRQPLTLAVEREGKPLTLTVTPAAEKDKGPTGETIEVGRIQAGIASRTHTYVADNPVMAVWNGAVWTKDMTFLTVKGLYKLVLGTIDRSNIGGPIQIASMAGQQAKEGLGPLAMFTAIISINLAILNLLPVPMLDGGHLFFFLIEGILGRPLSLKKREAAQQLGFVLLMMLMVYALYNDLIRLDAFKFFKQ
ncbi:MAG: RIP metalloprotease RseP [Candidatus Rokuibacteriota bacterium]